MDRLVANFVHRTLFATFSGSMVVCIVACAPGPTRVGLEPRPETEGSSLVDEMGVQDSPIITPEAGFVADTSSGALMPVSDLVATAPVIVEVAIQRIEPAVVGLDGGMELSKAEENLSQFDSSEAGEASVWRPVVLRPVEYMKGSELSSDVYVVPEYVGSVAKAAFGFYRPAIDLSRTQEGAHGIVFLSLHPGFDVPAAKSILAIVERLRAENVSANASIDLSVVWGR